MADAPKAPKIDYKMTKDTEKAIEAHAALVAETYRAKCCVEHPEMDAKVLETKVRQCKKEAAEKLTKDMREAITDMNEEINKAAKEGKTLTLEVGVRDIDLTSEENLNKALGALIELEYSQDVKREKHYYDKHLEMRSILQKREDGIKSGKLGHFHDLDMARLHTLNTDIVSAGEQVGVSKTKLAVDMHRFELRAYDSRLKAKEKPTAYEERMMGDDKMRMALVKDWLARDEKLLVAELKKDAEEKALSGKGTPVIPEKMPEEGGKKPEKLPDVLPPPPEKKPAEKLPMNLFESAKGEVSAILSGNADFSSDFNLLKKVTGRAQIKLPA